MVLSGKLAVVDSVQSRIGELNKFTWRVELTAPSIPTFITHTSIVLCTEGKENEKTLLTDV